MSAPLKPRQIDARQCRRCRKQVAAADRVAFTTYRAGDVATWICIPCVFALDVIVDRRRHDHSHLTPARGDLR